jgi:sulfate transport system ATP-binding protein
MSQPKFDAPAGESQALQIHGIEKQFGRFPALAGVSLDARDGEVLALLGPSGSGKTTLLRVLAGLEVPDTGSVRFKGENLLATPVRQRGIGMVFQHYALFRHMTAAQNIAFGLKAKARKERPDEKEIKRRVDELLALVQLDGLGGRYPAQLSGGQKQRIALARALAPQPKLLLLDEPFGALDAKVRRELRRWLRIIHEQTGLTTIFVTHDQEEALDLADRVAVLRAGKLDQVGTPEELYHKPANPFVFEFLGDTIKLPSVVKNGVADVADAAIAASGVQDGPSVAYLRPDGFAVETGQGPGLRAKIRAVFRAGPEARLDCAVEGAEDFEVSLSHDALDKLNLQDGVRLVPKTARFWPLEA